MHGEWSFVILTPCWLYPYTSARLRLIPIVFFKHEHCLRLILLVLWFTWNMFNDSQICSLYSLHVPRHDARCSIICVGFKIGGMAWRWWSFLLQQVSAASAAVLVHVIVRTVFYVHVCTYMYMYIKVYSLPVPVHVRTLMPDVYTTELETIEKSITLHYVAAAQPVGKGFVCR